jgi:hypothetical protein
MYAQKWKDLHAKDKVARLNISDLIPTPDGSFSLGYEYLIKKNISISLDAGYIFFAIPNTNVKAKNKGLFIRPSFRYYPPKDIF